MSATVSWVSAVDGNWSDGSKWSGGVKPSPGDDVLITVDGTYTVTLDENATVANLTLGGASGTQTLRSASKTLTLNSAGTIGKNGNLDLSYSTIAGSGVLRNQGMLPIVWYSTIETPLINEGTIHAIHWEIRFNGPFTNQAGAMLRIGGLGSTDLTIPNGVNHGTIEMVGGARVGIQSYTPRR